SICVFSVSFISWSAARYSSLSTTTPPVLAAIHVNHDPHHLCTRKATGPADLLPFSQSSVVASVVISSPLSRVVARSGHKLPKT
ncbi:unnamed protein product, partial [Citrullus colocynthis]